MPALVQTVPNLSEGRDRGTIEQVGLCFTLAGCHLADIHSDVEHNRSVYTVFGRPFDMVAGLIAAAAVAVDRIDLTTHVGLHPRVGALDVVPFVAFDGLDGMADAQLCEETLLQAAAGIGQLGIPVVRYGSVERFEWAGQARSSAAPLAGLIEQAEVVPLAGPSRAHASAGVTLAGVRGVLIAANVWIDQPDVALATSIAASIRERGGGFVGVRALGMGVDGGRASAVSMNLELWKGAQLDLVVERIMERAAAGGATIRHVELIGLAPADALDRLDRLGLPLKSAAEPRLEEHIGQARENLELNGQ